MNHKALDRLYWLAIGAVILLLVWLVKAILLPFVVGILVAYFLDPAADKLETWGLSRLTSTIVITVLFFCGITSIAVLGLPVLFDQLTSLMNALPQRIAELQAVAMPKAEAWLLKLSNGHLPEAQNAAASLAEKFSQLAVGMVSGLLKSGAAMMGLLSLLLITPVVTFYMLKDWDALVAHVDDLLPRDHAATIREQMQEIDATLSGFIRGETNVILILSTFYAIGLSLAGLQFAVAIGVIAGVLVIIPYVGVLFSACLALVMAYMQFDGDVMRVAMVAAVFVVGPLIEGAFLTPKLVGDKIGLHPVWILFGMLSGGALFGFVGVLISIPVTAVIGVLMRFAVQHYQRGEFYRGAMLESEVLAVRAEEEPEDEAS